MEIVNLDIIMTKSEEGYMAHAITSDNVFTRSYLVPLDDPRFLGTIRPQDLFMDRPLPHDATRFGVAILELASGFPSKGQVEYVGERLYALLPTEIQRFHEQLWAYVIKDSNRLLRVRFHFHASELAMLPWEYMQGPNHSYAVHPQYSLIRYPDEAVSAAPLAISPSPLRILIWVGDSTGYVEYSNKEIDSVIQTLKNGLGADVQVNVVRSGEPGNLLAHLRRGYHIWHYIGPSTFDDGEAKLVFSPSEGGEPLLVTADQILPGLLNNLTLKLIFLDSDETAKGSPGNPYASLALNFARYVPAVVGYQYFIPLDSARLFAETFYRQLSIGHTLDACIAEARASLMAQYRAHRIDWGIPILCTSTGTTELLQLPEMT